MKNRLLSFPVVPVTVSLMVFGIVSAARAQTSLVYSNLSTFAGYGYSPAGATTTTTDLVADDIQLSTTASAAITSVSVVLGNLGTTTVTARPILNFYAKDNSSGLPGVLLSTTTLAASSFTSGSIKTVTYSPGGVIFTAPGGGYFWAGVSFDNGGGSTATTSQLNSLAVGIYDPPTLGSSQDYFFTSTNPGVGASSSPAGSLSNFGGSPVANVGFSFTSSGTAPEPSAVALWLSGAVVVVGPLRRLRSRRNG